MGALQRAVVAQLANPSGKVLVIRRHGAAVAKAPQILLDDETQAHRIAHFADREPVPSRPDGLRAILHHE